MSCKTAAGDTFGAQVSWFGGNSSIECEGIQMAPAMYSGRLKPRTIANELLWPWIEGSRGLWSNNPPLINEELIKNNVSSWLIAFPSGSQPVGGISLGVSLASAKNDVFETLVSFTFSGNVTFQNPGDAELVNSLLGISGRSDFSADDFWEYLLRMMYILRCIQMSDRSKIRLASTLTSIIIYS
jgi:hypothetical protein